MTSWGLKEGAEEKHEVLGVIHRDIRKGGG
jgi:hypothetical protein